MRAKIRLLGVYLLALAAAPCLANCPARPIRTAFATPSMEAWKEDKVWRGYLVEFFQQLALRSGCAIALTEQTHTRTNQRHEYDVLGNVALPKEMNAAQAETNLPLQDEHLHLITAPIFGELSADRILVAAGLHLGIIEKARYGASVEALIQQLPTSRVITINTLDELYNAFNARRINATFANRHVHQWFLRKQKAGRDYFSTPLKDLPPLTVGMQIRKNDLTEQQFLHVRSAVRSLRDDGTYKALVKKYLGEELTADMRFYP